MVLRSVLAEIVSFFSGRNCLVLRWQKFSFCAGRNFISALASVPFTAVNSISALFSWFLCSGSSRIDKHTCSALIPLPSPHHNFSPVLPPSRRSRSHPAVSSPCPTPRSPLPYFPVVASPSSLSLPLPPPRRRLSLLPVVASPPSPSSPLPPPRRCLSLLPVVASPSSPPSPLPPPRRRRSILPAVAAPSSPPSPLPSPRRPLSLHAVASPSSPASPLPPPCRRLSLLPAVASSSSPPSPPATGARAQE
ncbi:unnamed protein product [Closterium sp. NIES-54]